MAKVLCKSPNASEEISGVKFKKSDDGMLSEDISDEQAALFASIPGYELVSAAGDDKKETKAEKARLKAEAAAAKEAEEKEAAEAQAKADAEAKAAAEAAAAQTAAGDDKK